MAEVTGVHVRGLSELQRAFALLNRDVGKDIKAGLESAAQPVRFEAAQLVHSEISGMARSRIPWWSMRIGVTRSSVYVAPVQRGVKGRGRGRFRRPNVAPLMLEQMETALEHNREKAAHEVEDALDDAFRRWASV